MGETEHCRDGTGESGNSPLRQNKHEDSHRLWGKELIYYKIKS